MISWGVASIVAFSNVLSAQGDRFSTLLVGEEAVASSSTAGSGGSSETLKP